MVLRGSATTIKALCTGADGEPLKTKAATVTIVRDSDGETVVSGASAGTTSTAGVASYTLAAQSQLDRLKATWTCEGNTFRTVEEIVGLRLCSLEAVSEDVTESLSNERKQVARDIAERFLEDECGVAFRPSYAHVYLDGSGSTDLYLPHPMASSVRSVTVGETELSEEELKALKLYDEGVLYREEGWPSGRRNVEVIYEHGFDDPPPGARRCAALLARHFATKRLSNLEDRSSRYETAEAVYTLIQPGLRGNLTSLPEVNAFIQSWQFPEVA